MTAYEPEGATGRPGGSGPPGTSGADAVYDAVVLAGGAARRLGGADKPGVRVGGRALLDRVLAACAGATRTVVVARPRATARPVEWAREDPPGGGPLAALDAGLRHTTAPYVVVLSADLPFLEAGTVRSLLDTLGAGARPDTLRADPPDTRRAGGTDPIPLGSTDARPLDDGQGLGTEGVLLTDPDGRDQPLVAVYRADALRRELAVLAAAHGGLGGLPLRGLVAALDLTRISDPVASFDCDTWDDIAAARARIREHGHVLDEWISAVKDELGIDLDVDVGVLLDLARDAAHGVARPAAPLTTFLVGYAAARAGGGAEAVSEAARKAEALALRWADEDTPDAGPDAAAVAPGASDTEPGAPAAPPVADTGPGAG
jgi:molybdopterin-guanine dinucleotide biosynthesis protein A